MYCKLGKHKHCPSYNDILRDLPTITILTTGYQVIHNNCKLLCTIVVIWLIFNPTITSIVHMSYQAKNVTEVKFFSVEYKSLPN